MLHEAAADHHRAEIGLDDQGFAELLHDDHVVDRAAAQAAQVLAERSPQDAQFLGEGLPVVGAPAALGSDDLATGLEVVLVLQEARDRVADHRLLFGEVEVHPRFPVLSCPGARFGRLRGCGVRVGSRGEGPGTASRQVAKAPAPSWR
jgi:hypothetical protein